MERGLNKMGKKRSEKSWTLAKQTHIEQVLAVVNELKDYWSLTLRQVYYQLVAKGIIPNKPQTYKTLSKDLSDARYKGVVPWEALEDRTRTLMQTTTWEDKDAFLPYAIECAFGAYRRDVLQSQPVTLELWIEKDALSHVVAEVADEYCVPVVVAKGYASVSIMKDCGTRVQANARRDKSTCLLYFGDLDPSGWEMLPAMMRTLHDEMGLRELVTGKRIALTPEQVIARDLPYSLDAIKESDSRTPGYKRMLRADGYPDTMAVELDALKPDVLQDLVRQAIESRLDMVALAQEQNWEVHERGALQDVKSEVQRLLQ
jgi:hypothetical protein